MADAICSSFGSKSLTKCSPFFSHYTASRPFFVIPSVSFHHSVHTNRSRKRRPLLHFACLCSSSSDFDVISTHEDSDGSFLFRFGDPSEVVKKDQVEETDLEVEGKGGNDEEDFSVIEIMDRDLRREVRVKKIKSEEKSEDSSELVDSESRSVTEIESSSGEASSSSSVGVQVLASGLGLDIRDSSELTEQVDGVLHRRGNIELNNSVAEALLHVDESIEENGSSGSVTQVENVIVGEECVVENGGHESPATLSPCPPDHVSGPEDQGASAEIVQPLSGEIKELISLELNRVVEVNRDSDNLKEQLIRNDVDRREAWLSLFTSEHGSGPEDHEASAEIAESLTGKNQELISAELDPVIEVPADDVGKENRQEEIEVTQISNHVYAEYIEAGTQNNSTGDSSKSEIINMLTLSSPLEAEPTLHEEGNAKNVEIDTQNDTTGGSSERELIGASPLSPPLEAETVLGKDKGSKNVEVKTQDDILGGTCEREVIGALPVSLPFGAEPVLDEGASTIAEVGSHSDINEISRESEGIGAVLLSPSSEAEPVLEEGGANVIVAETQNDVTRVSSESEAIGAPSPPLEAEPFLDEEGDAGGAMVVEAKTQNDVMRVSSESEAIGAPSPPSEAEPFLDEGDTGGAKVVVAGTQNGVMGVSSESEAIGPLSPPSEAGPFLDEEGDARGAKVVEAKTLNDVTGVSSGSEAIGAPSPPLEAEPLLDEEGDADVTGVSSESEAIGSLSPPLEVESFLDEEGDAGGAKVGEDKTQNDVTGISSESEAIGALSLSPPLEAEPFLDEEGDTGGAKVVEGKTQNDVTGVSSESEAIGALPMSPPLELEPFLDEEGDAEKMERRTENDIKGASSESELQPVPDNKAELEQTEIFDESLRSRTAITIDNSSEILEAEEVKKETVGTDEPVVSSDSGKTVSKPIRLGLQSEKIHLEKLFLSSGTASLPHPEKALAGGEDACFTCQNWIGVADGVSWWSVEGVDHGKYAQEVMEIAREIVSGCRDSPVTSPEEVLNLAIAQARYPGSSTVLISHFDGKDLHVANIGDSGVIILRNGAVCQRSSPMFHEYNFPVLVERDDDPSKLVERYRFDLDEGDVVVAATDGLFDNLYEQEIISTVSKSLEADKTPEEIAEILATRAQEVGRSTRTRSPFSDAAQAAGYTGCTGGKLDDVVVVVSLVKKDFDSCAS